MFGNSTNPCSHSGSAPSEERLGLLEETLGPREDRDPEARLFAGSGADALRTSIAKACKAAAIPLWSPHDLRGES
jgi:hypothetical protein